MPAGPVDMSSGEIPRACWQPPDISTGAIAAAAQHIHHHPTRSCTPKSNMRDCAFVAAVHAAIKHVRAA
eukprot:1582491-Rhodomonas_salina.3